MKEVFELPSGGNIPVRTHGFRWITYKQNALLRVIDRYGAYIAHLTSLSQDSSVKPDDKAQLKGYLKKWMDYKVIYGCALYADILKPVSLHSLFLHENDLDIVLGTKNILKSTVALKNLCKQNVLEWSTVKLFSARLNDELERGKSYEGAHLNIGSNGPPNMEWSDSKLLRSLLVFLETQIWIKRSTNVSADNLLDDEDTITTDSNLLEVKNAVEHIATHFRKPLNARCLLAVSLPDEVEEIVLYAHTYLSISQTPYRNVW